MEHVVCLILVLMSHFYAFITTIGKVAGGEHFTKSATPQQVAQVSHFHTFYFREYQLDFFSFNGDGFGQLPGKTARTHQYAKVANYQGQPFVVGGSESGNKYSQGLHRVSLSVIYRR